ncbi:MAG: HAMP domain-containing sensor histidine kinase [Planctomycetota bacterium]|nr:HAMP domain-containing sensor histidine kinase [Planctomycetota bacterium]
MHGAPATEARGGAVHAPLWPSGDDPLSTALAGVGTVLGLRLGLWQGRRTGSWSPFGAGEEHSAGVPLLGALRPGGGWARALGPADLLRLPGPRARGSRHAWIARSGAGGLLWLESRRSQTIDVDRVQVLCSMFETLEGRESGERDPQTTQRAHLARLGARAAGVAHDCRHLISLATFQLARALEPAPQLQRTLGELREACSDFLGGGAQEGWEEVDLASLAGEALEVARRVAPRSEGVRLEVDLSDAPCLRTLPRLLARAMRNLLLNAIDSCERGETVSLSIEREPGGVQIVVADGGRGMEPGDEGWLRAGASGSGGFGYGTVSLFECMDGLGARLSIDSLPGVGTRCVVRLGVDPGAPPSRAAQNRRA